MNTPVIAVELSQASKEFGPIRALNEVSLKIERGQVVAMLGPNGAGKTTAISLMLGLRRPSSGTARIFGADPREAGNRSKIGAMLQESRVPDLLKVRELLELFARFYAQPRTVQEVLTITGLTDKANAIAGTLSGGQRQRLCFGLAIIGNPDLLFLDEPTTALDVESRRMFWEHIGSFSRAGKTIILTTHYLEEADALAERIVVIGQGSIIADGSPAEIKARVGGKYIRFKSAGLTQDQLHSLPGVTRVEIVKDTVSLYTLEPEPVLRALLEREISLRDLEVTGAGLEEAIIDITHTTPITSARA